MSRPLRAAHAQCANIFASRHSPFGQVRPFRCLQAKGQSPQHLRRHERTGSQGPFLRQNYPIKSFARGGDPDGSFGHQIRPKTKAPHQGQVF